MQLLSSLFPYVETEVHRQMKFAQDNVTCKSQGWPWNLGRVYPFNHCTVSLLHGRNIWALLGTVA